MSSTSSDPPMKDRKRSAHWSDHDTEVLVNLLLRHKDSGRTVDNGFKPEIWREASAILEASTYMGGPKTPDACKSRWQRLQRDYKAAKDMEAMPGFTWDRNANRLVAAPDAWDHAEKQLDAYKYRKIHLPCFDSLAVLCVVDGPRARPRPQKGRSSLGSVSNASSMLSLSTSTTNGLPPTNNPNGAGPSSMPAGMNGHDQMPSHDPHVHAHAMPQHPQGVRGVNGLHNQQDTIHGGVGQGNGANHAAGSTSNPMTQLQGHLQQDHGVFNWAGEGGDEDGEGEFETSFTMSDGSQSFHLGQKRPIPFDPNLLSAPNSTHTLPLPQSHSPKKLRHSRSDMMDQAASQSQPTPASSQSGPNHMHPNQTNHTHGLAPPHTHPAQFYTMTPQQAPQHSGQSANASQNQAGAVPRSPDFNNNPASLLEAHILSTPPGLMRHFTPSTTPHTQSSHQPPSQPPHTHNHTHAQVHLTPSASLTSLSSMSAEVTAAGLSEAQRRTEAVLQLQSQETHMPDEDLLEVMAEFEGNVAAADTYLAIKKEGLRRMWLQKIVKRRKR
ncbi:hypothetical protein IAU60_006671 [Kwoniella sp. DSM 27419]